MSVCEFTTYATDADGEEWEVHVEVTEYQPGTPEWKGPRMEDYDPGNPPDLSYEVYYLDGTKADDLIESLPLIEKIRFEDEVLERAHEEWEVCFGDKYDMLVDFSATLDNGSKLISFYKAKERT